VPDVLVVDDDRAARESPGRALVKEGLKVREAIDGQRPRPGRDLDLTVRESGDRLVVTA